MPVLRKRAQIDKPPSNGLYIHSSPPRVLQLSAAHIKQLIRNGDVEKLEQVVIEGHGKKLIGEYSADYKTRTFLKSIPGLMSKISLLHDAVNSGRLKELQALLDEEPDKKRKLVLCKDEAGLGLLHKAVYYDLKDIYKWLIQQFPHMVSMKDSEGRTAYHYTPMCNDPATVQKLLTSAGADASCLDFKQHSAKFYSNHVQELELPSSQKSVPTSRKSTAHKESLNFKKSNIRIWIHQRNLGNLQQVVWEGHGSKLLVEHSNNPKIKKFLEAVPHIMGLIKEIHSDVLNDNLEGLKSRVAPPIPPLVLSGKDQNGLTPLHKAAGLGKQDMVEFIINEYPACANSQDNEGRTPLHYAALLKDDGKMMNYLIEHGTDESTLDNKQKTAAYYKTRNSELDAKVLNVVPECPRSAKESFAASFDWSMLAAGTPISEIPKAVKKVEQLFGNANDEANDKTKEEIENGTEVTENGDNNIVPDENANQDEDNKNLGDAVEDNNNEHEPEPELEAELEPEPSEPQVEESEPLVESPTEEPQAEEEDSNHEPDQHQPQQDSRPSSTIKSETRPSSIVDPQPSRPNSNLSESAGKTRPNSEMKPSRPNSNMVETAAEEPTVVEPEGVIEGVVNGENEVETFNNEGMGVPAADEEKPLDEEIKALVEAGNMEQLAALVLNGDGGRLVGQKSDNSELQSFLVNVPVYMSKINKIHVAARDGSLRDLQAALDRRKFAVAKDPISPYGATPLHVAVVFGNTSIVRYLAGRFPETVQMLDDNGRTPLHYAATLADNGHYYNLLVHLGGDTRIEDILGHTADYYRTHKNDFSHRSLLREFGAEENIVEEMLADKVPDDTVSARKNLDDEDMATVLERCYNVLHGRRNSNAISAASAVTTASQTSTSTLLSKHLKRYVFDTIKNRLTKLDHNLYDMIWPSVKKLPTDTSFRIALEQDFPTGLIAPDFYVYRVFSELIQPIIKDFNSIDLHQELGNHPTMKFIDNQPEDENRSIDIDLDLDPNSKWIISGTLDYTRNLADFELPKYMHISQLEQIERIVTTVLLSDDTALALYPNASEDEIAEKGSGVYYTMNEVLEDPSEARIILASNGLLIPLWNIPDSDRLHGKHWPYGRGVFISNGNNLAVWINVLDHIRIVTCTSHSKPGNVGQIYSRVCRLMSVLNKNLEFRFDDKLGYLSARPTASGNTMQFNIALRFPYLIKEPDNLRHLCVTRGLMYHRNTNTSDVVRIGNQQCLNITELQLFEDFTTAVANILQLEKDLAMTNSLHIAAMFVNIFRRKKSNTLSEED